MDKLQKEIERLIAEAEDYKGKGNENKYNAIMDKVEQVRRDQAERRQQIEQVEQAKQERITEAKVKTTETLENMDIDGIPLRDLIIDEPSYRFVLIAFQSMLNTKDSKYITELAEIQAAHKDEIRAFGEREANLNFQLREKDKQLQTLAEANNDFAKLVNTLTFERDEALKVRDNAAAELEGYKLAVEEKQKQIDTLRAEIAVGAKGAVQIDRSEQLKAEKEAFLASRIKVTGIRWEDELKKTHYLAEDMDGNTIRFGRLEKGKYLEVSEEDAARFRDEREAAATVESSIADAENDTVPCAPLVTGEITPPEMDFRQEALGPVEGLDTAPAGEVVSETPVTRKEFEEFKAEVNRKIAEITGEVA